MNKQLMDDTKEHVKGLFRVKSQKQNFQYHNWEHSENVMEEAVRIAENCNLSELQIENIAIAALFHDVGYENNSEEHEKKGAEIAEEYLKSRKFDQQRIDEIKRLILATKVFTVPNSIEEMVIKDADLSHLGKPYFFRNYYNLQAELNTVFQLEIDDEEWRKSTIEFLNKQEYYTSFAKENYRPLKLKNLQQLLRMNQNSLEKVNL